VRYNKYSVLFKLKPNDYQLVNIQANELTLSMLYTCYFAWRITPACWGL